LLVVRAAGGMNVMIAGIPSHLSRVDPTVQAEGDLHGLGFHFQALGLLAILRAAGIFDGVLAGRQQDELAIGAIDLGMKGEIGREALGLRRIDAALGVADQERSGGGTIVEVEHAKRDFGSRFGSEQKIEIAAETEVLRSLPDVKAQSGFTLSGVA